MNLDDSEGARFSRHDPATTEQRWWLAQEWDGVPSLDLPEVVRRHPHVMVLAAHPDDETIGVGGLISDLSDLGADLTVLIATSGERSHDLVGEASRGGLAAIRRRESERALSGLAPRARVVHLELPDTRVAHVEATLVVEITARVGAGTLVIAPWLHDGHGDHDAVGRAALEAVSVSGAALAYYPIWMWHWSSPAELDWAPVMTVDVTGTGGWRKRAALEEFRSQTETGGLPGSSVGRGPVLDAGLRERASRLVETLLDPHGVLPTQADGERTRAMEDRREGFERMYDGREDPWRFEDSFYESRRLTLITAFLERPSYQRVLEIGCADGRLTASLTKRSREVVAMDTSARAVQSARRAAPRAAVVQGTAPRDLPQGPFDLVIISEVGYFLSPTDLIATLRGALLRLAPDGELLLCHWQHPTVGVPLDGPLVHQQATSVLGREPRASYRDGDLLIDTWREGQSLAEREGRA
ncbi:MAG: bifunctional PIG-L family deacetylase/class I SAM-dependent methyltransferase [Ornithinibacter sp.]